MADASHSKCDGATRGGSNPPPGTTRDPPRFPQPASIEFLVDSRIQSLHSFGRFTAPMWIQSTSRAHILSDEFSNHQSAPAIRFPYLL